MYVLTQTPDSYHYQYMPTIEPHTHMPTNNIPPHQKLL